MSYEVDVGNIGSFTLSQGWLVTMWNSMPGEFAPGQWFRLALQLDPDNSSGVSIVIGDTGNTGRPGEGIFIDNDGLQKRGDDRVQHGHRNREPDDQLALNPQSFLNEAFLKEVSHESSCPL
jgi:hypothetical protein